MFLSVIIEKIIFGTILADIVKKCKSQISAQTLAQFPVLWPAVAAAQTSIQITLGVSQNNRHVWPSSWCFYDEGINGKIWKELWIFLADNVIRCKSWFHKPELIYNWFKKIIIPTGQPYCSDLFTPLKKQFPKKQISDYQMVYHFYRNYTLIWIYIGQH